MFERYRIWLKDGSYVVAVAKNRDAAVSIAVHEKGVNADDISAVGKATSKGRLFKCS